MNDGGTEIYCPFCKGFKVCSGSVKLSEFGSDNSYFGNYYDEQRRSYSKHADLSFFARGRLCLTCKRKFITVEIHEDVIKQLVELRNIFDTIKQDAEIFTLSSSAVEHLTDLSNFIQKIDKFEYNWES